ncbi:hypothetical protein J2789_006228 [Variovorax paradoxus]|uniref:hypothetical protein n=1 Tax=Variovorax atrisoli TaxID=3394203 RepID=UPI00119F067C|nr:hypothetical protein [Variovorax paradoxus]MDR6523527.1 hypothetical protein [Variovorax paradoxus]
MTQVNFFGVGQIPFLRANFGCQSHSHARAQIARRAPKPIVEAAEEHREIDRQHMPCITHGSSKSHHRFLIRHAPRIVRCVPMPLLIAPAFIGVIARRASSDSMHCPC